MLAIRRRRGWSPIAALAPLAQMQEEMSDVLSRFFGEGEGAISPAFDVSETQSDIIVKAELPGLRADDIRLSVENNVLTISGEKREDREEKQENYHVVERRFGSFYRSLMLPASVDPDKVDARFQDGVLTLRIPKTEQAKPRQIQIRTEAGQPAQRGRESQAGKESGQPGTIPSREEYQSEAE